MKKFKIVFAAIAFIVAFTAAFASCKPNDDSGGAPSTVVPVDTTDTDSAANDVAGKLDMAELSADVNDDNARQVPNGDYVFTESGSYALSGAYGALTIGANELKLHLFLNGASFTSLTYGTSEEGDDFKKTQLTITLAEGTTNTVQCSKGNAIHIKGSVDVNGKGNLTVNCTGKNAVKVSKALRIADAVLELSAANHAVSALSIAAADCTLNVNEAGKDGLNAECDDETTAFTADEGFVALRNVNYVCNCSGDGIQADTIVYIDGGSYDIITNGEFVSDSPENRAEYDLTADDFRYIKSGSGYQKVASDYFGQGVMYALKQGCKGVKAGEIEYPDPDNADREITVTEGNYCVVINGGVLNINSTDDAIHSNSGNLIVNGGEITVTTLDDGLTADGLAKITDGSVTVAESYEGLEGGNVEISGGKVFLVASDDGINAASDDANVREHILISGGEVVVNAQGDGIDSNGSVELSGGTVVVYGPAGNGDGGLDSETGIYVNGGTLLVLASRGMTELPVGDSKQLVLAYGQNGSVAAGTVVSILDGDGNKLIEVEAAKAFQTVIFSSCELAKGSAYSIYADEVKLTEIKLTSQVTSGGISGGFGGNPDGWQPGGPGGGPGRPGGGMPPR